MEFPIYSKEDMIEQSAKALRGMLDKMHIYDFWIFNICWEWNKDDKYFSFTVLRFNIHIGII